MANEKRPQFPGHHSRDMVEMGVERADHSLPPLPARDAPARPARQHRQATTQRAAFLHEGHVAARHQLRTR